jgi:hypothetical protein
MAREIHKEQASSQRLWMTRAGCSLDSKFHWAWLMLAEALWIKSDYDQATQAVDRTITSNQQIGGHGL